MARKKLRYQWYETSSDFQVEDTQTGESRGMGDGVDMFSTESGRSLSPGTKAFDRAMDRFFINSQDEIGEAYFSN